MKWLLLLLSVSVKAATVDLAFDGDSQTEYEASGWPWPRWLTNQFNVGTVAAFYNGAQSGRLTSEMASRYASHYSPASQTGFYFVNGGTVDYDCAFGCVPWPQTLANLSNCWRQARADGRRVVAFTVPPAEPGYFTAGETNRLALNSSIRASPAQWDYLVDLAAVFGANHATNVVADHLHWTLASHQRIAREVYNVVFAPRAPPLYADSLRMGRMVSP